MDDNFQKVLTEVKNCGNVALNKIVVKSWKKTVNELLQTAVKEDEANVVKLLIEVGADVNHENTKGLTAMMEASRMGNDQSVKLLIEAGADVNHRNKKGYTALMNAVGENHVECVKLLIEAGADVNHADNDGWTALTDAAWDDNEECVKLLIEAGADVNYKRCDTSALCWAVLPKELDLC